MKGRFYNWQEFATVCLGATVEALRTREEILRSVVRGHELDFI
jgi:hypothetical protein